VWRTSPAGEAGSALLLTRTPLARTASRIAGLAVVLLLVAHVRLDGRPSTLCTLRALTGVPCPFCGGTTAAVRLGSGDLGGAVRASPLALLLVPVAAALPGARNLWSRLPRHVALTALAAVLVGSELWQLHRFGWL
jgi:hypothetical protein